MRRHTARDWKRGEVQLSTVLTRKVLGDARMQSGTPVQIHFLLSTTSQVSPRSVFSCTVRNLL